MSAALRGAPCFAPGAPPYWRCAIRAVEVNFRGREACALCQQTGGNWARALCLSSEIARSWGSATMRCAANWRCTGDAVVHRRSLVHLLSRLNNMGAPSTALSWTQSLFTRFDSDCIFNLPLWGNTEADSMQGGTPH